MLGYPPAIRATIVSKKRKMTQTKKDIGTEESNSSNIRDNFYLDKLASALVHTTTLELAAFLGRHLPNLGEEWWDTHVKKKLVHEQDKKALREGGISTLEQLDCARLLKIVAGNWNELSKAVNWPPDVHTWIKELQNVRNRLWGHTSSEPRQPKDIHRDIDTLARVLEALEAAPESLEEVKAVQEKAFAAMGARSSATSNVPTSQSDNELTTVASAEPKTDAVPPDAEFEKPDAGDAVVRRSDSEAAMPAGGMGKLVAAAWAEHEQAAGSCRVDPSIPILFFGDLEAYRRSELRVMTVGFHPSGREFPGDSPFERFPGGTGNDSTQSYLNCLSSYFRVNPYRGWFHQYDAVLDGAQASYYAGKPSTALHTNFVSPIATNPTWGRLADPQREALLANGVPLWHRLLMDLKPHVVFLTISRGLLAKIEFASRQSDWQSLAVSASAEPGSRSRSYAIDWRWHEIASNPSLFIFYPSSRIPFGLHQLKTRIGELAREKFLERTGAR